MASQIEEILGRNINSVKELKKAIGELQNSLIGLDAETQEFKDTSYKLAAAQDELTKVTKAGKDENIAATDSIVGMQKEYKKLYDQYKLLSEEQRNSDFGKNMAESLETLSTKLNDTKKGVGNFKDNIGRYAGDITDAFSKMGLSVGALQGPLNIAKNGFTALNATMKANPVGIIITAITALIALFKKMKDAVSQNEELQMRWNEAMAKFQPIVDAAKNGLDNLAKAFTAYVEWISKCVEKIREFGAAVTDFLGITKGAKQQLQETQKIYDDIAKSTNNLTKTKREYQKLDANDKARVEALREEASETTNLEEKQRLLTEAKEIQAQIDQRAIEVAEEELRILEEQDSLTANDAAANDKLAAATARVSQAQATAAANARMFNKQLSATTKTTTTATSSMKNYREEAKKLYEEIIENSKDEITKLTEKYEKEKKLLEKYHYDTTLLTKEYNKNIANIQADEAKKIADKEAQIYQERLDRASNIMSWAYKTWGEGAYYEDLIKRILELKNKSIEAAKLKPNELENTIFSLPSVLEKISSKEIKSGIDGIMDIVRKYIKIGDLLDFSKVKEIVGNVDQGLLQYLEWMGEESWKTYVEGIYKTAESIKTDFGVDIMDAPMMSLQTVLKEKSKDAGGFFVEEFLKGVEAAGNLVDNLLKSGTFADFYKKDKNGEVFFDIEEAEKEFDWLKNHIPDMANMYENAFAKNDYDSLLSQLETIHNTDLDALSATTEQKLEIWNRYYEILNELAERQNNLALLNEQRTWEMVDNLIDATDSLAAALGTIKSSYDTLVDSELRAGKIDEKQAQEKKKRLLTLEKVQTAFSIATIAADAAAGLFSIWKGYATEVGTINPQTAAAAGPGAAVALGTLNTKSLVSAIAKSASLAATATAQIMAARNGVVSSINNFSAESAGSSGSGDVGASPILIDSTPYSYTRTVQTEEDVDNLNKQPIWVSVEDISSGLGHKVQVTDESSF